MIYVDLYFISRTAEIRSPFLESLDDGHQLLVVNRIVEPGSFELFRKEYNGV